MSELQGNPIAPQNPYDTVNFSAYSLVLATALGFVGAAFAGFELQTCLGAHGYAPLPLGVLFGAIVFSTLWCSEIGPSRWRPILLTEGRFHSVSAISVAAITVAGILVICAKLFT